MLKSKSLVKLLAVPALVAAGVMALPESAQAQSLFGNSGALSSTSNAAGSASRGGSSRTGTGANTGSFGSGSQGGAGRSGASGSGLGANSMAQPTFNTGDGSLGATIGTSGFVGRGDNAGRFIGSQNSTQRRTMNNANQFSQLRNQGNQNRSNVNNTNVRQLMRPQVQLGFEPALSPTVATPSDFHAGLMELPGIGSRAEGVVPSFSGDGVVTLTGTVATEDDRRMMEVLTRMEPGVREVKNELRVVTP